MPAKSIFTTAVFLMTLVGFVLTVGVTVVLGIASMVEAMGDTTGGSALRWVGLALGVLLAVDLICLVLTLGMSHLAGGVSPAIAEPVEPTDDE